MTAGSRYLEQPRRSLAEIMTDESGGGLGVDADLNPESIDAK